MVVPAWTFFMAIVALVIGLGLIAGRMTGTWT